MASIRVSKETEDELQICREPSTKAWAILVGITSLGIGAAYYCNDWFLWKLIYISGAVFVGLSCFEDWEECTFDKKEGQVKLKTESAFQKIFGSENNKTVAAELAELVSVEVKDEDVRYAGKGYMVVMQFQTGISLGITDTAILGERSELEVLAEKIITFTGVEPMSENEGYFGDNTVTSTTVNDDIVEVRQEVTEDEMKPSSGEETMEPSFASATDKKDLEKSSTPTIMSSSLSTEDDHVTSTITSPLQQQDSDSSSSDDGFEKIEKPPSDFPTQ